MIHLRRASRLVASSCSRQLSNISLDPQSKAKTRATLSFAVASAAMATTASALAASGDNTSAAAPKKGLTNDEWVARWKAGQTGWHLKEVNPALVRATDQLPSGAGKSIFVPLCGKTKDMAYLASLGFEVYGVDVASGPMREFFSDNGLNLHRTRYLVKDTSPAEYEVLQHFPEVPGHGPVNLMVGDFFALSPEPALALPPFDAVYDRASLVAIDPSLREKYVKVILSLLKKGGTILLVVLQYETGRINGPPFSVSEEDVVRLYGQSCSITKISTTEDSRFRDDSKTPVIEVTYRITKL